jgi:hypothetical protein
MEDKTMFNNAYGLIWLKFSHEKVGKKFPEFLRFCKTIEIADSENGNTDIKDDLSSIDYKFYKTLLEGGVITKREFRLYIIKERKVKIDTDPEIESTDRGYILHFNQKNIYVDTILRTAAKLYFGIDNETWNKVELLFYAILECDLDMNEDDIRVYIGLLNDIEIDPIQTSNYIVNRLKRLKEFKNIRNIEDVIGTSALLDNEESFSKSLVEFLLETIEKIRKSKKKSEELKKNVAILKAIMNCY